jgi:hypothetical protein
LADITTMADVQGLLGGGYPASYFNQPGQGMSPYYWIPTGLDPFLWPSDSLMAGMPAPPDAPQPPPAAPQVPPVPSAPPSAPMPTPGVDSTPPGLLNPPPVMTPPPSVVQPPPPPTVAAPPPSFGQPGYTGPGGKSPIGRGGEGRQGGASGGGGFGSGAMGGGAQGGAMGPNGEPKGMAHGGYVSGERTAAVDDQVRALDEGEYVLRRASADALGPYVLSALNDPKLAPKLGPVIQKAVDDWIASRR